MSTPALPSAPRRLRADAARNRAKVLDAARIAFAEHGPDAQMEEIARRAGVGVGTVYRHYPTKQALAEALLHERFEQIIAYARELLEEPDPWRAIVRSFEHCAATQEHDRGYVDVLTSLTRGPAAGPQCEEQVEEVLGVTATLLERARAAGAVRADLVVADLPPLYCGLASVVNAGVADWRRYLEIVLDGLRPRA